VIDRNLYRPEQRWMVSGLRLARDVGSVDRGIRKDVHLNTQLWKNAIALAA
jgi:hypothetical protein